MLRIGITGGMGSGKSVVSKMFLLMGIAVYDADTEAKKLMEEDAGLILQISKLFGKEAYENGKLNRTHISQQAFTNPEKLKLLNATVHPAVIAHGEDWMRTQKGPYIIKEAALIFESGSDKQLDFIIGVWCPEPLRIQRILKRDRITMDMALARINKQMNEQEKMERSDFVITNDEHHAIIPQVLDLHQKLLDKSERYQAQ
jgi:dephospho-CoA kinase